MNKFVRQIARTIRSKRAINSPLFRQVLCTLHAALCTLALFTSQAQSVVYPVQVNTNLVPPYSLYLDDYAHGSRERISVTLINRDMLYPSMSVQLRLTIKGSGFVLQSTPYVPLEPIALDPNVPYRLSQEELAPLFNPQHLTSSGLGSSAYLKDGRLPEGMLEFCIEVLERNTGRLLSRPGCGTGWVSVQRPPMLSLPLLGETVAYRDPLNLLFQWTPQHSGVADVEYQLVIKQLWDNGMRPEAAWDYSPEVYRETIRPTSLVYGAAMPPLIPGMRYAWAVQAVAKDGMDNVQVFDNKGLSEIWWFQLADYCPPPLGVQARSENSRIVLSWTPLPDHLSFVVSYRTKDKPGAEWFETKTLESSLAIYDVRPGFTYEYRIGTLCRPNTPIFGDIASVYLPPVDTTRNAQCGVAPDVDLSNKEPLAALTAGEQFMAGDFPVFVTSVSGANGSFTGEGYTIVPFLANARVAVHFTGIGINSTRQLINGSVDAVYDASGTQIANLDDIFEGGAMFGKVNQGITVVDHRVDFSIDDNSQFSYNPEDGTITVTNEQGKTLGSFPAGTASADAEGAAAPNYPITVQDKNGNIYSVAPSPGNPSKLAATNLGKAGAPLPNGSVDYAKLDQTMATITFTQADGARYAFDQWRDEYSGIKLIYPKYELLGKTYRVPIKLLPTGKSDVVRAQISLLDKSMDPRKVIFKTPKGTEFNGPYKESDASYTINLAGGASGDAQEVYALYPKGDGKYLNLGKLLVVSYPEQHYTTVAVPVNGTQVNSTKLQARLNEIYKPYGVSWTVEAVEPYAYTGSTDFFEKGSGLLSAYTPAMNTFQQAYATDRKLDGKKSYLFFFEKNEVEGRDEAGFMPRNKQFGYLFTKRFDTEAELYTAAAHELGHGQLVLKHTFDKDYGEKIASSDTFNLMSYGGGTHLAKWQWDQMHDPGVVVRVFEGDEEGKKITLTGIEHIANEYRNKDKSLTFYTPALTLISLPANTSQISFSTGDAVVGEESGKDIYHTPIGSLINFTIEGKVYSYRGTSGHFNGYFDNSSKEYYIDSLTKSNIDTDISIKPLIAIPYFEDGSMGFNLLKSDKNLDVSNDLKLLISGNDYKGQGAVNTSITAVLDKLPTSGSKGIEIGALLQTEFYPKLTDKAIEFLTANASLARADQMTAPLVIAHAQQISRRPIYDNCLGKLLIEEDLRFIQSIDPHEKMEQASSPKLEGWAKMFAEYILWKEKSITQYNDYEQLVSTVNKGILDQKTQDAMLAYFKQYFQKTENCLYDEIDWDQRNWAIQQLASGSINEDCQEYINLLIASTVRNGQSSLMVDALKANNNALFKVLWNEMDFSDFSLYIQSLSNIVLANTEVPTMTCLPNIQYSAGGSVEILNSPCFEFIEKHAGATTAYSVRPLSDGRIGLYGKWEDADGIEELFEMSQYDPFEIIKFSFPKGNCKNIGDDITKIEGAEFYAPAFYGAWLIHGMTKADMFKGVRLLANGAVIYFALPSGGSSLSALGAIEIALSGTDILIQLNTDELAKTSWGPELTKEWDDIYTVAGLSLGATYAYKFASAMAPRGIKITSGFADKFKTLSPPTQEQFLNVINKTVASLSSLGKLSTANLLKSKLAYRLAEINFNTVKVMAQGVTTKVKNNIVAFALYSNMEFEIATFAYRGGQSYFKLAGTWSAASGGRVLATFDNVYYARPLATQIEKGTIETVLLDGKIVWRNAVEIVDDINPFVLTIGSSDEAANVAKWLDQINDGRLYIAVHGEGSSFMLMRNGQEVSFTHRSLATVIKDLGLPADQEIVLLTCADGVAAQNLANSVNRNVVAWEGATEVYQTGLIKGEGACSRYMPGKAPVQINGTQVPVGKAGVAAGAEKVVLGSSNAKTGIFKAFNEEQIASLEPAINKAISTIKQRGKESLFTDLTKTDEAIKSLDENNYFTLGDLVELPARYFLKNTLRSDEMVILNVELKCFNASGKSIGGSLREIDALKINKVSNKLEKGITMKLSNDKVASGVSADRASLRIYSELPDNTLDLRKYFQDNKVGLGNNQIDQLDHVKIIFTDLESGGIKQLAPSEFRKYIDPAFDLSKFEIEGLTPSTLSVSKQELLEGTLELIRKKL